MDRDMAIDFGFDFPFDIDFDDSVARDVQRYVGEVVSKLGLRGDSSCVELTPHVSAYVALDGRLPDFPDHYVALVWNEQSGWSMAVEDRLGELVEAARLGGEPRPSPAAVAGWVDRLLHQDQDQGHEQVRAQANRDFAAFMPVPRAGALS